MLSNPEEFSKHFEAMRENAADPLGNEFTNASSNAENALKQIKERLKPFDSRNPSEAQNRFLKIERAFFGYVNSVLLHSKGVHAKSTRKPFVKQITEGVPLLNYHLNSGE